MNLNDLNGVSGSQSVLLRHVVLFILARNCQLRIIFFHSHIFMFYWECIEKEKLAHILTEFIFKWSKDFYQGRNIVHVTQSK